MPDYRALADVYAGAYGVPQPLFSDIINQESGFNPLAYNATSGATGIAQILPSTAANPGYGIPPVDPTDPNASLAFAAQYLHALFVKSGSWLGAVSGYSGTSSSATPYPGNTAIAGDLTALGAGAGTPGSTPTTGAGAGSGGTSDTPGTSQAAGQCGLSPSCWFSYLGTLASRAALILLAVILLLGAVYLFATRTQATASPSPG